MSSSSASSSSSSPIVPRTERLVEADAFYEAVYDAARRIPESRVSSYGHLAKLVGHPRHSRLVGQALKYLPPHYQDPAREDFVPWHRVINSQGSISARGSSSAVERQARYLRAEGVEVLGGGNGALEGGKVSMRRYGWFEGLDDGIGPQRHQSRRGAR